MKRKVKKFNGGGKTYDRETEGLFGGKIKYREDDEGRKFVAGNATPFERNPQEQRFYTRDDVKKGLSDVGEKISNFFGGKKEAPKYDELKRSSDAGDLSSYHTRTKPEAPTRKIEDYIKKSEPKEEEPYKPTGKTVLNKEADIDEKPAKKIAAKKVVAKKVEPKASQDSGFPKDTKSTRMPSGYDKLDPRSPEEKGIPKKIRSTADVRAGRAASEEEESKVSVPKNTFLTKERQDKADKSFYAGFKSKPVRTTADIRAGRQVEGKKKGGIVKSASARADGCAIRGKTRA